MDGMGKTGGFLDGWGFQTKAQTDCDENQGNILSLFSQKLHQSAALKESRGF